MNPLDIRLFASLYLNKIPNKKLTAIKTAACSTSSPRLRLAIETSPKPFFPMGGQPQFDRQSSFTQRLRSSYFCFSCCFNGSNGEEEAPAASLLRSSSDWIRDKAKGISEMVSKFNRNRKASGDFRYDPISYALNFDGGEEDDADVAEVERLRIKNFSSRLPASPSVRLDERSSSVGCPC